MHSRYNKNKEPVIQIPMSNQRYKKTLNIIKQWSKYVDTYLQKQQFLRVQIAKLNTRMLLLPDIKYKMI